MDNLYSSYKRKEVKRIYKNGEEITKNISYILQFTDSARFMASSMLNLANNLSAGVHRIKCKLGYGDKKCEICGIKYKCCDCFLEYKSFKDDLKECKCLVCNENCQTKIDEKLNERFFNIFKCSIHDNNKFILLLIKGVCSYKYMDDWKKFSKSTLSEKEDFYSLLNMEGITNADYANAKKKSL